MSQYTEILPDGTRRVVRYNPHHDGPVSEHLTMTHRISWLARKIKRFPFDGRLRKRLSDSARQLNALDRRHPRVQSPPRHPTPCPKCGQKRSFGKPLDQRKPEGYPLTVEPPPGAAVIATACGNTPAAPPPA